MIQDIFPSELHNSYTPCTPRNTDRLLCFDRAGRLLVRTEAGSIRFPSAEHAEAGGCIYAFSVDSDRYFLAVTDCGCSDPAFSGMSIRELRDQAGGRELFAAFTGYHLWKWYAENVFCGRCGAALKHHDTERALRCEGCGNVIYPRINPAVIVGVVRGSSILVTRYRRGYAHNALVAGFTEIGETLEQTAAREVMEETGIRVKNIRYYKSQPWGMAQDILVGFFCDADGSSEIRMDENELKSAEWISREALVLQPNQLSLTNEMMQFFRDHPEAFSSGGR